MIACNGYSTDSSKMLLYPYAPHNATTFRRYTQATSAILPKPHRKAARNNKSPFQELLLLLVLRRCLPLRRPPHSLGPVLALLA